MPAPNKPAPYLDIALGDISAGAPRLFTWNDSPFVLVRTTDAMLDDLQAQTTILGVSARSRLIVPCSLFIPW